MKRERNNCGFSLMEVLLAMATLSIGMIFVAGVFPVAIHFSTIATERTIAAVVADEAFAKIRIYGEVDLDYQNWLSAEPPVGCVDFSELVTVEPDEFAYPSDPCNNILRTRYCWSALCRRVGTTRLVQVTVFINRKIGSGTMYHGGTEDRPIPVPVGVSGSVGSNVLAIEAGKENLINDDYTIVDDLTGRLYRVLERYRPPNADTIVLDRPWDVDSPAPDWVWVVPSPVNGGRYPCLAAYQKVIRF